VGAVTGPGLPVVLAVDGGGSKTDVITIGLDGEVVASARGGRSNPQLTGWPVARGVLDGLRAEVLRQTGERPVAATHVYLAGLDLPPEYAEARRQLAHWAPWRDGGVDVLDNDLFALLRGGTLSDDAVAVICGTGLNAIAVRADGATARFPALGDISGDWGGGSWLGNRALWHAARAADGRGPATVLERTVPAALGAASVEDAIAGLHFGRIAADAVTELCPVLLSAAAEGDAPALGTVRRQAEEIVTMAVVALRRLGLEAASTPLVLGGGVLAARPPALVDALLADLAERAPRLEPVWVTAPPIVGAGLAALEAAGADPDALDRFTAAFDDRARALEAS
jgi:N-acetylglucosamine kinase-like BadF-type ATPase